MGSGFGKAHGVQGGGNGRTLFWIRQGPWGPGWGQWAHAFLVSARPMGSRVGAMDARFSGFGNAHGVHGGGNGRTLFWIRQGPWGPGWGRWTHAFLDSARPLGSRVGAMDARFSF
nr:hypothetical protein Iba_chr13fCG7710 [Ipomoea batatas]